MMKKTCLGEIADIITGPFGSMLHKSDYVLNGNPIIMPVNIGDRTLEYDGIARISEADSLRLSKYKVQRNDIVYARRGDVEKHAFIEEKDNKALFCGTGCLRVRVDDRMANPLFVSFYLNRPETRKWISGHAVGSNMPNINTDILSRVPIELPEREVQDSIAGILQDIDLKIRNNKKINDNLEHQLTTIFDFYVTPSENMTEKVRWNEAMQSNFPVNWNIFDINDICDVVDCLHSKKPDYCYDSEELYLLGLDNITPEGYIISEPKYYISEEDFKKWSAKILLKENDFVITNAGRAGDIGKVPPNMECAIGRNITAIHPHSINPYYLRQFFKSRYFKI